MLFVGATLVRIEGLILVVCTGNTCRSPMAAALLAHHLGSRPDTAGLSVASAGTLGWSGRPATAAAVTAVARRGADLTAHRSRSLRDAAADLERAAVVIAMTRVHAGAVAAHRPALAPTTFLPAELVRLAAPRATGQALAEWAAAAGARRTSHRVVGRAADEIDDPIGHPPEVYEATAARLDAVMASIAEQLAACTVRP
jgi:protein-tyrosine-phosphatase